MTCVPARGRSFITFSIAIALRSSSSEQITKHYCNDDICSEIAFTSFKIGSIYKCERYRNTRNDLLYFLFSQAILEADGMMMVPHAKFGFLLLLILLIALAVFALVRFTLKRIVGVCFVVMYILFVAYAYIQDLYCDYNC